MNEGLALLRVPFPPNQISYLPKGGVKLAYVGHAALTDRLLDADPMWTWEPMAMGDGGLPVMDEMGGMWIRLTVCGVTRLGYGHAGSKTGGDAIKEVIGDALRNAAMRFGAALDLWHKGDLHGDEGLVPALEASIEQVKQKKNGAMGDAWAEADRNLAVETKRSLSKFADRIAPMAPVEAFELIEEQGLEPEEKTYLWGFLNSKLRSAMKHHKETQQLLAMKETA